MHGFFASLLNNTESPSIPGFNYKRSIVIDNTGSNESFINTQIKITLNSTNFDFSKAKVDGGDIRFYDSNIPITYFKESYNQASQLGVFYINMNLNAITVKTISIYYGNSNLSSSSDWLGTMQRFQPNLYGGDTKYLLRFNEGIGSISANEGSLGGNISVQNSWSGTNNYGFSGSALNFNGANQNVNITGLLDTYPNAGEISFSFKASSLAGGKRLFSKFNRLGTQLGVDEGDYFSLFINSGDNKLALRNLTSIGSLTIFSNIVIEINTLYKVTIIWTDGAIGLYVNGNLEARGIFYKVNGSAGVFKLGCFSNEINGSSNLFFDGSINDFRFTDYTIGQVPSLVHVEAEHQLTKFFIKDKRTKLNAKKDMIITNFPTGNMSNYKAEPFGMFDNGLFKLWYSAGDSYIHYREATTTLGLRNATDQLVLGNNVGGEVGDPSLHSLYKEAGIFYMYYAPSLGTHIYVVTSTDGINWSNKQIALQKPVSGWGSQGLVNTWVSKLGSTYHMFVEAGDAINGWSTGRATATNPLDPFTIQDSLISAFQIGGTGSSGGYTGWHDGTKFNIFYHANPNTQTGTYDQTYFTSTSDLINYTTEQMPTIKIHDDITAFDQTADVNIFTHNGKVYFYYSALDNRTPFFAGIILCEFNGTYEQLKKDLTILIESEQIN